MYKFINCNIEQLDSLITQYKNSLVSPFDSFLEDHIKSSNFYKIVFNDDIIGYFAIHKKELLTQFYLVKEYRYLGQELFAVVKKTEFVQSAFVYTGDEFFMSHALDNYKEINKQAYFFQDSGRVPGKEIKNLNVVTAQEKDLEMVKKLSKDFFDAPEAQIKKNQIYIAYDNDTVVGFGITEDGNIFKECESIGMYICEEHREKGYGRSLLVHLKEIVHAKNKKVIAGCWYYNHLSKKTLESAGLFSQTRLLKINY